MSTRAFPQEYPRGTTTFSNYHRTIVLGKVEKSKQTRPRKTKWYKKTTIPIRYDTIRWVGYTGPWKGGEGRRRTAAKLVVGFVVRHWQMDRVFQNVCRIGVARKKGSLERSRIKMKVSCVLFRKQVLFAICGWFPWEKSESQEKDLKSLWSSTTIFPPLLISIQLKLDPDVIQLLRFW